MWSVIESFCGMFYMTIKENEIGKCTRLDAQERDWSSNECTEFYWEGLLGASLAKIVKDRESRTGLWGIPWWLLPMQETRVRSLIWEDPTCRGAAKPVGHNRWACTLEPTSHSYWALSPGAHALQRERPPQRKPERCNERVGPTCRNSRKALAATKTQHDQK